MPLIKDETRVRLDIPHEPGEWIEIRPMRNGDLLHVELKDKVSATVLMFERLITGWSYEEPVTPENIRRLDIKTASWLDGELTRVSGVRTEEEKNGSSPSS